MRSSQQLCIILDVDGVNHKRLKRKNRIQTIIIIIIITFARAVMKVTTHKMFNLYYKTHLGIIIICFICICGTISLLLLYIYYVYIHKKRSRLIRILFVACDECNNNNSNSIRHNNVLSFIIILSPVLFIFTP